MAGKSKNTYGILFKMPNWKNSKGANFLKQELSELLIFNSEGAICPDTLIRDEIYYHDTQPNMFD